MAQTKTSKKPKSKPRSAEDARVAILKATRTELAENGWRKFSVDRVAKSAKASKQTIYRYWPAIGTMCVDAGLGLVPRRTVDGRDPAERIAELIIPIETALLTGSGHEVIAGAILAAADDKDAGERLRNWVKDHIRAPLRLILAEFATKKIVSRDTDLDECIHFLLGPIWNKILIMRSPLESGYSLHQAKLLMEVIKL